MSDPEGYLFLPHDTQRCQCEGCQRVGEVLGVRLGAVFAGRGCWRPRPRRRGLVRGFEGVQPRDDAGAVRAGGRGHRAPSANPAR